MFLKMQNCWPSPLFIIFKIQNVFFQKPEMSNIQEKKYWNRILKLSDLAKIWDAISQSIPLTSSQILWHCNIRKYANFWSNLIFYFFSISCCNIGNLKKCLIKAPKSWVTGWPIFLCKPCDALRGYGSPEKKLCSFSGHNSS